MRAVVHCWIGLILAVTTQAVEKPEVEVGGHVYPRVVTDPEATWTLSGADLYKYKGLIRLYSTALYVQDSSHLQRLEDEVPKRLVIRYFRDIPGSRIIENGNLQLRKNVTAEELSALQDRVDRINNCYGDVAKDDEYILQYIPGKGTELWFNGGLKDTVPGEDFGRMYFRIWLGKDPVSKGVRDRLMGKP